MTKTIEQRGKNKNNDQAHAWRGLSNRKKGETKGTGKGKKIDEKKEFLTVISPLTYQLAIPSTWRIHPVFHASLLTPYIQNDTHGPSFTHPPPEIINNEEEYEVEAIVSHKGKGKRRRYLVKWVGYESSENSLLTEEALANSAELLSEYKALHHLA